MGADPAAPIGVFDSGIGGLSILKALLDELPHERFVYVADSGHAPYGERDEKHVIDRSFTITRYLVNEHHIKALVVACNTATAAAIQLLRQSYPDLPIIGVEPPLKPAVALSQSRRIGVMATRGTVNSHKFKTLLQSLQEPVEFITQPCDGLADAIERQDLAKVETLCSDYTQALGSFGQKTGDIDTLVLGCTHYPFVATQLQALLGPQVQLIDSGKPVARQTGRMLKAHATQNCMHHPRVRFYTTGQAQNLQTAVQRWLHLQPLIEPL